MVVEIVLAGVLGGAVAVVVVMYRRIEDLSRQLSDLRVQIASQKIIRAARTANGSNGNGNGGTSPGREPPRRGRHLWSVPGGAIVAMLSAAGVRVRDAWQAHPSTVLGSAVAVAVLAAALLFTVWQDGGGQLTPPAATPTSTIPPRMTLPPSPSRAEEPSPTTPGEATFLRSGTAPGPGEVPLAQSSPGPVPSGQIPSSDTTPGPGATTPPDPRPTGTERPDTATPTPPTPDRRGLCLHVAARPVLDLDACLPLGR